MDAGDQKRVFHVPLASNDIRVIDEILQGITAYLRNTPLTAQTVKRIQELQDIRERILFLGEREGNTTLVTREDVHAIGDAMRNFVRLTRRLVPHSSDRDETLQLVERLRKYLEESLLS